MIDCVTVGPYTTSAWNFVKTNAIEMAELTKLLGEKVVKGKDELVDVASFAGEGKVVGIYFSAHWCPPCRAFTPQLADWYKKVKAGPNGSKFEIVFVSSDRDEQSMKEYFGEMPWHAVPYDDRQRKVSGLNK